MWALKSTSREIRKILSLSHPHFVDGETEANKHHSPNEGCWEDQWARAGRAIRVPGIVQVLINVSCGDYCPKAIYYVLTLQSSQL